MAKKLYIGNLAPEVSEDDLRENFKQMGEIISVQVMRDRYTGSSRGFGFVEMGSAEEAEAVIKSFNGGELCGKKLVINEARPREETRGSGGGRGGGGGGGRGGFSGGRGGGGGGGGRGGGGGGWGGGGSRGGGGRGGGGGRRD
jgi:RNA recognition motif-containing protein